MQRTILIVDDSKTERVVLNGYLKADYDLLEAVSGEGAIKLLRKKHKTVSAIILDVIMSGMDGFETLKAIRSNAAWLQIPVIITTGLDDEASREKAIALGADNFITKPYNRAVMLHILKTAIDLREIAAVANTLRRDSLTGLLNRESFFAEAERMIGLHEAGYYMLSCLDIENFKVINDQYGTDSGDEVLLHIARCLGDFATDNSGLACRYMADKFAVLFPAHLVDSPAIDVYVENLIHPDCVNHTLRIRIGRYLISDRTLSVSAMYDRASMAEGLLKGRFDAFRVQFAESMRDELLREQQIVNDMVPALQNGEFEPWFQPQYNHATGALIGSEALIRWRKNGRMVFPNDFIAIFEKNGFIYEVDQYVWRQICILLRRWLDAGKNPLPVSVNISRYDIYQAGFLETISSLVAEYRLPADLLRLEITESAFSESTKVITAMVNALIERGFTVEIDDFGSGYSSLNTLKDVPASILKLDMRFFEATENSQRGGNIVESIVRMAKWLGMAVIAEGVEDKAQADYLKSIGCYYIQGYYYSRPIPAERFEQLMDESSKEPKLTSLVTLSTLDNNEFWNPKSMETLIFNSYVGGACIFEFCRGKSELLRVNDQYVREMGGLIPEGAELGSSSLVRFLDQVEKDALIAAIVEAVRQKTEVSREVKLSDGAHVEYIRITMRLIATTSERYLFYAVIVNLTEQREAERKQAESARQLEAIMGNVNGSVSAITMDDDGNARLIFGNDNYYGIFGYTKEQAEALHLDVMSCIIPDDFEHVVAALNGLKKDGKPVSVDYRARKRDGSLAYIRSNSSRMHMEGYGDDVIVSVETDITERLTLEDQLHAVIENINGGVSATYLSGDAPRFVIVNDKYYDILGYTKEQFAAEVTSVFDLVHPDDRARVEKLFREAAEHQLPYTMEYRIIRRNGAVRHILCNTNVIHLFGMGEPVQLAVSNDVTVLREAQQKERDLSLQMQTIMDNIHGGITATVFHSKNNVETVFANDGFYELYGYTREQLQTELPNMLDLILPEDREKTMETVARIVRERGNATYEYRCRKRDGSIMWTQVTNAVISMSGVGNTVLLAIVTDITALRKAQRKEAETSDKLNAVLGHAGNGITAIALYGDRPEFLFSNDRYYEIVGYTRAEYAAATSEDMFAIVHPDDREALREKVTVCNRSEEQATVEYRVRRKDGGTVFLRSAITITRLSGVDVPVQIAVFSDVTAEKESESQLRFLNDSAHDILAQPDTGKAINGTLDKLMRYFAAERGYVVELDEEQRVSNNTYEVCAPGVASEMARLKNIPFAVSEDWFASLRKNEFVIIEDVATLGGDKAAQRELLLSQHIRSLIISPLWRDGALVGFVGLDNPASAIGQVDRLRALGDYIAILLTRRDLRRRIAHDRSTIQTLMDDTPGGFCRIEVRPGKGPALVGMNAGFCRMLGMTEREAYAAYGDDMRLCLTMEDIAAASEDAAAALSGAGQFSTKCRLRRKDGKLLWTMVFGRFVKGENGKLFLNAYFTDISEKKSAEAQQAELLDHLPIGAGMYEFDGRTLTSYHINNQYETMVNRGRGGEAVLSPIEYIHPDDRSVVFDELNDAIRQRRNAKCDIRLLCGGAQYLPFHLDASMEALGGGRYMLYVAYTRITEQEMSFKNLLPAMFSTIMESSTDLAFAKDVNFRYICCSRTFAQLLGLSSERDVVGKTDYELFGKEIADLFRRDDSALFANGEPQVDISECIPSPDGTQHYIRTTKHLLRSLSGEVVGVYCTGREITEEREAYAQLRLLTDSIPGGILTFRCTKSDIRMTYYNDGLCALSGYTREEYERLQIRALDFTIAEDRPAIEAQIAAMLKNETPVNCTVRIRTKDGSLKWVNCKAVAADHTKDALMVNVLLTDITEQQEEKEKLRISEELGRLALEQSGNVITRFDVAARTLTLPDTFNPIFVLPHVLTNMPEEQIALGRVSPSTAGIYRALFEGIVRGEASGTATYQQISTKGWRWMEAQYTTVFSDAGKPVSAVITFSDVTDRLEKEVVYTRWHNSLAERPEDSYTLFRCNLSKGASYESRKGSLLHVDFDTAKHTFNERTAEYMEQCVYAEDRERYRAFLYADTMLAEYYRGHRRDALEYREISADGVIRWLRLTVELVEYPGSKDIEAYLMYEDIDAEKRTELATIERAETDPLTGILNRATFAARANQRISISKRGAHHAMLMLDIDNFKQVNDVFGHGAGDQALTDIADMLTRISRKGDLVGRLGGDEFLLFLSDLPGETIAAKKAQQICELARKSFSAEVQISASVGIALYPEDGDGFEALYRVADETLYRVKGAGKNSYAFHHDKPVPVGTRDTGRAAEKPAGRMRRMLIVDDSKADLQLLAKVFDKRFRVETAADGKTALAKLHHFGSSISVVLLDLMMPGMDGYELLKAMQQNPDTSAIPVIVVSADEARETALKVIRTGASDLVTKPVDPELLRIRVESAVSKSENERLRAQNSFLTLQSSERDSYRAALAYSGILVATLNWVSGTFTYSPAFSDHLAGSYDARSLWRILLSDMVTDSLTVQKLQNLAREVAEDRDRTDGCMTARLKTASGQRRVYDIKVFKEANHFGVADKLIFTFREATAPANAPQQ